MKILHDRSIAIVACAEVKNVRRRGRSAIPFGGEVLTEVLANAGLTKSDVDGLAVTHALSEAGDVFWTNIVAEALGLAPRWSQLADIGGASAMGNFPINFGGGQISAGQPGLAGGGLNLFEAVRQLMGGGGKRQVARARNAMVTGIGSMQYARNRGTSADLMLEAA